MNIHHYKKCIFCKDIEDRALSYWISTINNNIVDVLIDNDDAILYETEHFCVIPDIAPLTIGHVLIVSKDHIRSMTQLSLNMAHELHDLVNTIDSIISRDKISNVVHFEHGPGKNQENSLRSIDHFHLHCVPIDIDIKTLMRGYEDSFFRSLNDYEDIVGSDIEDYIFCESFGEKHIYLIESSLIKSQLLRESIFQYNKQNRKNVLLDDYDWKIEFNIVSYQKSKEFLVQAFGRGNRKC